MVYSIVLYLYRLVKGSNMKKCAKCGEEKELENFSNNKAKKDGKCAYCRECYAAVNRSWRQNNPDKDRSIHKKWKEKNPEHLRKKSLEQYYKHHEKNKERNRKWKKVHKNKVNELNKEYHNKKYHNDTNYKITRLLRGRFQKLVKGIHKKNSVLDLLGCSVDELKVYLATKFADGMSWSNHGEWHIDHIKPCSKFDLTKLSEQKKCFHYTNLQPLWAKENLSKNNKFTEPDDLPDHIF